MEDIQFLSEYLEYIEIEKGLSPNTLDAYRHDLTNFMDFCRKNNAKNLNEINRTHFNSYILDLRDKNFNPRSVVRKIASLRGFFKWLSANNYIKTNPAQTLEQPKLPKSQDHDFPFLFR